MHRVEPLGSEEQGITMEFRFPITLPVVPMMGDPIEYEGETVAAAGEFSRLTTGQDRFAVEGADGHAYEVSVAVAGNGRRGSQRWKATRRVSRDEFLLLFRSPID